MVRRMRFWHLPRLLWLAVLLFALAAPDQARAIGMSTKGAGSPQCSVIIWQYTNGYTQLALLERSWKDMSSLHWQPDGSKLFQVRWRDGKTQSFTLRQAGKNLKYVGFRCQGDGYIHLKVTDCKTKQPLNNALVSDITGKQFRGLPTGKDGWGVVPCNCYGRLPQTVNIKVSRSNYQTAKGKVNFSKDKMNRYGICLNQADGGQVSQPQGPAFVGVWRGDTWCSDPSGGKKPFTFTVANSAGKYLCQDHTAKNKFKPGYLTKTKQGLMLNCPWYRAESNMSGVYHLLIDKNDPTLLYGYEATQNAKCKQYRYQLRKVK